MQALETVVIYALVGLALALASFRRERTRPPGARVGLALAMVVFWPLLAPMLFTGGDAKELKNRPLPTTVGRVGELERRLVEALRTLEGGAGEVVAAEVARVRGLLGALASMETRLGEMDALLATAEFDAAAAERTIAELAREAVAASDPRSEAARAKKRQAARLQAMRTTTAHELARALGRLEELVAQLKLLRFAAKADATALATIRDIADAVGGATEAMLDGTEPGAATA